MKLARIVLWVSLGLGLGASPASQDLSKEHERWLKRDVSAIITRDEASLFQSLPNGADRELFQQIFWLRRDPDLSTPANELREELDARIAVADDRFRARFGPGSRTDMGAVFLLLGFPESVGKGRATIPIEPNSMPESLEGSSTELIRSGQRAGSTQSSSDSASRRMQTWNYPANEGLGIPDELRVQFRAQPGIGYRLIKTEELDAVLESRRRALVAHEDIRYDLDANGHLLPPSIPSEATVAAGVLDELMISKIASGTLSFDLTPAFFRSEAGTTYFPLLFEIDPDTIERTGDIYDVTFFGAIETLDGELVQRFEERADLRPYGEDGTVRFEIPLQLPPGTYTAYLGIRDEIGSTHGSRVSAVQIPSFDTDALTMSSVVVFHRLQKTSEPSGVPGRAYQFAGIKVDPKGRGAFLPTESLGLFFYVYGTTGEDVTARYVFYKEGVEKAQTKPRPLLAGDGIADGSDEIPVQSFEPGSYEVLIQVEDLASGTTVESRARFEIGS